MALITTAKFTVGIDATEVLRAIVTTTIVAAFRKVFF